MMVVMAGWGWEVSRATGISNKDWKGGLEVKKREMRCKRQR